MQIDAALKSALISAAQAGNLKKVLEIASVAVAEAEDWPLLRQALSSPTDHGSGSPPSIGVQEVSGPGKSEGVRRGVDAWK